MVWKLTNEEQETLRKKRVRHQAIIFLISIFKYIIINSCQVSDYTIQAAGIDNGITTVNGDQALTSFLYQSTIVFSILVIGNVYDNTESHRKLALISDALQSILYLVLSALLY